MLNRSMKYAVCLTILSTATACGSAIPTDFSLTEETGAEAQSDGGTFETSEPDSADTSHEAAAPDSGTSEVVQADTAPEGAIEVGGAETLLDSSSSEVDAEVAVDTSTSEVDSNPGTDAVAEVLAEVGVEAAVDGGVDAGDSMITETGPSDGGTDAFDCDGGACLCAPSTVTCTENTIMHCDAKGQPSYTKCLGSTPKCMGAACVPCSPGETQCSGLKVQTCDSTGFWNDSAVCPFVCTDSVDLSTNTRSGTCSGMCVPGTHHCIHAPHGTPIPTFDTSYTCSDEGGITASKTCVLGCDDATGLCK